MAHRKALNFLTSHTLSKKLKTTKAAVLLHPAFLYKKEVHRYLFLSFYYLIYRSVEKELCFPTEKEFINGLGDTSQLFTKKMDASDISTTSYFSDEK